VKGRINKLNRACMSPVCFATISCLA